MGSFLVGANLCMFCIICIHVLSLEIQLSREEGWDPVSWFNPTTFLCLYQTRIMIFQRHRSYVVFSVIRFVDIVKLLSIRFTV